MQADRYLGALAQATYLAIARHLRGARRPWASWISTHPHAVTTAMRRLPEPDVLAGQDRRRFTRRLSPA